MPAYLSASPSHDTSGCATENVLAVQQTPQSAIILDVNGHYTTGWFLELQTLAFGSPYVLPIRLQRKTEVDAPMEPVTLNAAINAFCKNVMGDKCRRFTPHDLRSTARSYLGAMGVDILIAERCLNHSLGGLVAVYDQHDYLSERRKALTLLSNFIEACQTGKPVTVVPLKLVAV